jgi:hypothetical protein
MDSLEMEFSEINVILSTLEIKGLIKETYGIIERIA